MSFSFDKSNSSESLGDLNSKLDKERGSLMDKQAEQRQAEKLELLNALKLPDAGGTSRIQQIASPIAKKIVDSIDKHSGSGSEMYQKVYEETGLRDKEVIDTIVNTLADGSYGYDQSMAKALEIAESQVDFNRRNPVVRGSTTHQHIDKHAKAMFDMAVRSGAISMRNGEIYLANSIDESLAIQKGRTALRGVPNVRNITNVAEGGAEVTVNTAAAPEFSPEIAEALRDSNSDLSIRLDALAKEAEMRTNVLARRRGALRNPRVRAGFDATRRNIRRWKNFRRSVRNAERFDGINREFAGKVESGVASDGAALAAGRASPMTMAQHVGGDAYDRHVAAARSRTEAVTAQNEAHASARRRRRVAGIAALHEYHRSGIPRGAGEQVRAQELEQRVADRLDNSRFPQMRTYTVQAADNPEAFAYQNRQLNKSGDARHINVSQRDKHFSDKYQAMSRTSAGLKKVVDQLLPVAPGQEAEDLNVPRGVLAERLKLSAVRVKGEVPSAEAVESLKVSTKSLVTTGALTRDQHDYIFSDKPESDLSGLIESGKLPQSAELWIPGGTTELERSVDRGTERRIGEVELEKSREWLAGVLEQLRENGSNVGDLDGVKSAVAERGASFTVPQLEKLRSRLSFAFEFARSDRDDNVAREHRENIKVSLGDYIEARNEAKESLYSLVGFVDKGLRGLPAGDNPLLGVDSPLQLRALQAEWGLNQGRVPDDTVRSMINSKLEDLESDILGGA